MNAAQLERRYAELHDDIEVVWRRWNEVLDLGHRNDCGLTNGACSCLWPEGWSTDRFMAVCELVFEDVSRVREGTIQASRGRFRRTRNGVVTRWPFESRPHGPTVWDLFEAVGSATPVPVDYVNEEDIYEFRAEVDALIAHQKWEEGGYP